MLTLDSIRGLTEAQRIHLRQEICAAGPQPHKRCFELIVLPFFLPGDELKRLIYQVGLLQTRFFESKNQHQENVRSIALHAKRQRMQLLLDEQTGAESMARKCVEELLDHHLLIEQGSLIYPNIPVQHIRAEF